MQRAGAAAAAEIAFRFPEELRYGVLVATGAGNNGGDGWVIARALHDVGIQVRVVECAEARTEDARAERALAVEGGIPRDGTLLDGGERIVVDALLGTGYQGGAPLRDAIGHAVSQLVALKARGAHLVAIDVPSGLDATTGASATDLACDLTLTFGTVKRGQLAARDRCGRIVVLDIGLGIHAKGDTLATPEWFRRTLPLIPLDAHKGTRKKIAIVGGSAGLVGAVILAARGALSSGAGMVRCIVEPEARAAIQASVPAALTATWPTSAGDVERDVSRWADAVLIGPGLGRDGARTMTELVLSTFRGPVVIDADSLHAFTNDASSLAKLIGEREALLTPHPLEFSRLSGLTVEEVNAQRFVAPGHLAASVGAVVLLKGVPTVIANSGRNTRVVAQGTPILATGGAGDVLGGIAATLLAQTGNAFEAATLAAYAHGRAAAMISERHVRGFTLDDVVDELREVWSVGPTVPRPPILAELTNF